MDCCSLILFKLETYASNQIWNWVQVGLFYSTLCYPREFLLSQMTALRFALTLIPDDFAWRYSNVPCLIVLASLESDLQYQELLDYGMKKYLHVSFGQQPTFLSHLDLLTSSETLNHFLSVECWYFAHISLSKHYYWSSRTHLLSIVDHLVSTAGADFDFFFIWLFSSSSVYVDFFIFVSAVWAK